MMPDKNLKYNINHYISLLPRSIAISEIIEILQKQYNISSSTFDRDRNVLLNSKQSIPTDRLDKYSLLLDVPTDQLKNYTPEGKSIFEQKKIERNLNTGLVKP